MPASTSLFRRFLSLFSRNSPPLRESSSLKGTKTEDAFVQGPTPYGQRDIPTEVIVQPRQPVVLVQIERRKSAANPKN